MCCACQEETYAMQQIAVYSITSSASTNANHRDR